MAQVHLQQRLWSNCVEAATTRDGSPALRDSKNPDGPMLLFSASQWRTFTQGIKLSNPSN